MVLHLAGMLAGTFGDRSTAIVARKAVFVVEDGKAMKKEVTLGIQNTEMIEVLNGLPEGALVIVEGNFGLEDGSSVEVIEEVD